MVGLSKLLKLNKSLSGGVNNTQFDINYKQSTCQVSSVIITLFHVNTISFEQKVYKIHHLIFMLHQLHLRQIVLNQLDAVLELHRYV